MLNDVSIPAAVALLSHISGAREVVDDRIGTALGDVQSRGKVTKPHARIVSNAQQRAPVVRQEAPVGHDAALFRQPQTKRLDKRLGMSGRGVGTATLVDGDRPRIVRVLGGEDDGEPPCSMRLGNLPREQLDFLIDRHDHMMPRVGAGLATTKSW